MLWKIFSVNRAQNFATNIKEMWWLKKENMLVDHKRYQSVNIENLKQYSLKISWEKHEHLYRSSNWFRVRVLGMQSTPLLPSLSGLLWPRGEAFDKVLSIREIELNFVLMLYWRVSNITLFDVKTVYLC